MRQGVASLILGLALVVASASWAGFTLSRTVLDPGRSERLADQLLENPQLREALIVRTAGVLEDQVPLDIPVRRDLLEAAAEQVIDDPRVEAVIRDGLVQVHQNALAGNDEPVAIDGGELGAAGRAAMVEAQPALDLVLPPAPSIEIELPTAGLARLGTVKRFVDRYTLLGALAALAGVALALGIARERAPVLRRVALWGFGTAAFWLVVGFAVPRLAAALSPTSGAIAGAATDVFFGAMIGPAIIMAVVAACLLAVGLALPAWERRRGARVLATAGPMQTTPPSGPPTTSATGPQARTVDSTDEMPRPQGPWPAPDRAVIDRGPTIVSEGRPRRPGADRVR